MIIPLASIAEVRMGYSFRDRLELDAKGDVAVIQMKDIDESNLLHPDGLAHIQMPELKERHLVQQGDLMFRSRGGSNLVSLVAASLDRTVLAAPMILIRPNTEAIDPAYLQWFINQSTTQSLLASRAEGTMVKMISKTAIMQLPVAVPSLLKQRRIAEIGQLAVREARLIKELMERRKVLVERILLCKAKQAY